MNLLVTGGAGFIGSNFIHYWLQKYPDDIIINVDALTYAGNVENLSDLKHNTRHRFIMVNIADQTLMKEILTSQQIDVIINFAAESHNGRAMLEPDIFTRTNVLGTQQLLEAARNAGNIRFHHISTCEVFGDHALEDKRAFRESDPYRPRTPYNASKAGANHVVMAYYHTFGLPVTISHCSNNYGPYQFPEKLIPRFITSAMQDKELPLFKSSHNRREWLHVDDHCRAIDVIIKNGRLGEAYNIGSGVEKNIEEIADLILKYVQKPSSLKTYVEDRPGHDRGYLLDTKKISQELGWRPVISFEQGLSDTIEWYKNNQHWWRPLEHQGYAENYKKM